MCGAVKLTKNANPDKYKYCGYGIGFDTRGMFRLQMIVGLVEMLLTFGAES